MKSIQIRRFFWSVFCHIQTECSRIAGKYGPENLPIWILFTQWLLFIPHINTIYFGTKLLKYNGPLTWNNFFQSINNSNFSNKGHSRFKRIMKDLLSEKLLVTSLYDHKHLYITYVYITNQYLPEWWFFALDIPFLHRCRYEKILNWRVGHRQITLCI